MTFHYKGSATRVPLNRLHCIGFTAELLLCRFICKLHEIVYRVPVDGIITTIATSLLLKVGNMIPLLCFISEIHRHGNIVRYFVASSTRKYSTAWLHERDFITEVPRHESAIRVQLSGFGVHDMGLL